MSLCVISGPHKSACGYCQHAIDTSNGEEIRKPATTTSESFGAHFMTMKPHEYDSMIQRNWRRSGMYLYRPNNAFTCCPQYTIRLRCLETKSFDLSHLRNYLYPESQKAARVALSPPPPITTINSSHQTQLCVSQGASHIANALTECVSHIQCVAFATPVKLVPDSRKSRKLNPALLFSSLIKKVNGRSGHDFTKQICDFLANRLAPGSWYEENGLLYFPVTREIFEHHAELSKCLKQSPSDSIPNTANHHSSLPPPLFSLPTKLCADTKDQLQSAPEPDRKLRICMTESDFHDDEYRLYVRYQKSIHHDPEEKLCPESYTNFLCDSPLLQNPKNKHRFTSWVTIPNSRQIALSDLDNESFSQCGNGSFHIRYELFDAIECADVASSDELLKNAKTRQLIAVSVVDVLPTGISSVYFMYDPKYKHLSLGTVSVFVEARLVSVEGRKRIAKSEPQHPDFEPNNNQHEPKNATTLPSSSSMRKLPLVQSNEFLYYYMGFYIHHCSKMKYKARFQPTDILCPMDFQFTPLSKSLMLRMNKKPFGCWCDDSIPVSASSPSTVVPSMPLSDKTESWLIYFDNRYQMESKLFFSRYDLKPSVWKNWDEFYRLCGPVALSFYFFVDRTDLA